MNFMICELYFNKTVTAKLKTGKQNKRLKRFGGKTKKKKNALQTPPPKKAETWERIQKNKSNRCVSARSLTCLIKVSGKNGKDREIIKQ